MIIRVHEDRFLECGLADFIVAAPDDYLVVGVGFDDFEAEGFRSSPKTWSSPLASR